MKKIISIATILTVAAMVAGPAGAATTAELQAQIAALQAQLAALTAQLGTATGTGAVPTACVGVSSFTSNMTVGSSGQSVKCLQALLNQSATTQVATTGAGSPGMETTYFGNATKAAVVKYQTANAIAPAAGYVGPLTRTKLNAALAGGTPGTPGTPAVGCTSATEGSYTSTLSSTPVSRTVNGGVGLEAYGVDIKAVNSDISVGSVDLQVSVTNATTAVASNPGTFISGVRVYKDSTSNLVASFASPSFTLDTAGLYYTSLTGLNFKVTNGTTSKLLVVVDTGGSSDNNRTVVFNIYGNGIRGRDCAGIDRFTALATTRTLTIQPASGNATMAVALAGDNPNSQNIQSNTTNGVSTDTTIMKFNAKAQGGSTTMTRVTVYYTTGASELVPSVMYLKDGSTTVSSCTPNATENRTCTFENFRLPVAAEETKNMKIDANWSAMTASDINVFRGLNMPAAANTFVFERSDGSQIGTAFTAALNANTQFIVEQGVKITLVSATATPGTIGTTQAGVATGKFTFQVQPFGGTLTQFASASVSTACVNSMSVEAYWSSSTTIPAFVSGTDSVLTRVLSQNPARNLSDGETGTVEVQMTLSSNTSYGSGSLRFKVEGVQWTVGTQNLYQGEFDATENKGANFTDTWFTNWTTNQ